MVIKHEIKKLISVESGSTLIGVALLTVVMGFLMTGGIYLLNTYDAVNTKIESEEKTADLQKALRNFIGIHKRYPCPAPIDVAPDQPGFGLENCSISDVSGRDGLGVKIGAAPVRTLNVPDDLIVDGFGRRHIYAITSNMTDPATADVLNGLGAITILHKQGAHEETLSSHEGYIVYALMSPGADDRGAYDLQGNLILPCEAGTIAGENCDMADATFYTTLTNSVGDSTDFTHNFAFVANTPEHYWYTGPWSQCGHRYTKGNPSSQSEWSGTGAANESEYGNTAAKPICFSSHQEREVVCRDRQGNDVADSECSHTAEPLGLRTCSLGPCRWQQNPACCSGCSTPPTTTTATCAPAPSCGTGMTSIVTGKDTNDCNTYLCVSETCAKEPICAVGTLEYKGLDGSNCPMWLCSTTTTPTKPKTPTNPTNPSKPKTTRCYEGPTSCPAGMRKITGIKNPSTGCWVRECLPPCPTPTCPAGQFVKMKTTNGGYVNGYCQNWSCVNTKPTTSQPTGPTTTPSTPKPTGPTTTPTTPKPTGPTTSCPTAPSCGTGKTLKNNGKNALGCTQWSCVATSCPSAPTCSGGKTLKTTGQDKNGCTTYQCTN